MKQYIETGKIVGTHGVEGELKVEPWSDGPDFLLTFARVFIDGAERAVAGARVHKSHVLLTLDGVNTVEQAMAMRGKVISIDRADASLPQGSFFVQDLIGFSVYDLRQARELGILRDVLHLPAGDIYVVKSETGECMIPARPEFLKQIDPGMRVITVSTIRGMADDDAK